MKRIFTVLAAVMILLTSVSLAEDLSALSDEELAVLYRQVLAEMESREAAAADLPAFATINEAFAYPGPASLDSDDEAVVLGMEYEGKYIRVIAMLDEHAKELRRAAPLEDDFSGWDAFDQYAYELPVSCIEEFTEVPKDQAELDALVGKTFPELLQEGYTPFAVWGEGESRDRHMIALAYGLYSYSFEFDMTDEDYTKYTDEDITGDWPAKSVRFHGFSNEALSVDYNPDGTPRTGTASLVKKTAEPADNTSGLPEFATINEAVKAAEGSSSTTSRDPDFAVLALEYKGKYLRVVSALDDHGKELYKAAWGDDGAGFDSDAVDEFYAYARELPVSYIEEFTVLPMTQKELDALNGKTVREIMNLGYSFSTYSDSNLQQQHYVGVSKGIYSYLYDAGETYDKYLESGNYDDLMDVTLSNGRFYGFSGAAASLWYNTDGTLAEDSVTEEEAEPAEDVPEQPLSYATISEAKAEEHSSSVLSGSEDSIVYIMEKNGRYYRLVTVLDDHAKELYKAGSDPDGSQRMTDEYYEYAASLPVSYMEEFTALPMTQEELDALSGKTFREITGGRIDSFITYTEDRTPPCIGLAIGLYRYDFEIDEASYAKYKESHDLNDLMDAAVTTGRFAGYSSGAIRLTLNADGTEAP